MGAAAHPKVKVAGQEIPKEDVNSVVVDMDLNQPDMCQIGLKNAGKPSRSSTINLGDAIEVQIAFGATPETIFKGEVCALEPTYDLSGKSMVMVRGFNRLHRLTRGRKSRTFENMSDQEIAQKIAQEAKLTAKVGTVNKIKYKHVYQHNQTDLEFLLQRATRIDYEVLLTDEKTLEFRKRDVAKDSGIKLKLGKPDEDFALQRYTARLSAAVQLSEVQVRGWDPAKRKEIVGKAKAAESKMGKKAGGDDGKDVFGTTVQFEVDDKVTTQEEADARAKSILEDHLMNFITGEGIVMGHPKLKAGIVVEVELDSDDRFAGKHYLTAVSHRYSMKDGSGKGGGYTTAIRFKRNAGGKS